MPLPPSAFYSVYEVAARWGCTPADVAGWAATEQFQIVIGISPVTCGAEVFGGIVQVAVAEMLQMFRRFGPSEEVCVVRRILPQGRTDWVYVTDPEPGILVRSSDLMLTAANVLRFEEERELLRGRAPSIGAAPRYDWDAMYVWLFKRVHERGIPASQAAMIGEVQDWFGQHSEAGEVPEDSTIRKRLAPLWRELRGAE